MLCLTLASVAVILVATLHGGLMVRAMLGAGFVVAVIAEGSLAGAADLVRRRNVRS